MASTQSEIIFGYGSNLSSQLLRDRLNDGDWHPTEWRKTGHPVGPDPLYLGIGVLANYQFKYNLDVGELDVGKFTTGNIVANYNEHVYGAVYKITREQLALLDKEEDEGTSYVRTALKVQATALNSFGIVEAWCYVGKEESLVPDNQINPDPDYVDHLVQYAEERSLPPNYIDQHLRYNVPIFA